VRVRVLSRHAIRFHPGRRPQPRIPAHPRPPARTGRRWSSCTRASARWRCGATSRRRWPPPPAAAPWCTRATATASPTFSRNPSVRYMHDEALVALPELLDKLEIDKPVLVGHSDGGSIALIHAGGAGRAVAGLILMAPHVFVEDLSIASIAQAKVTFETTDLAQKLGKYHRDPRKPSGAGTTSGCIPTSAPGTSRSILPKVTCPVLALQGAGRRIRHPGAGRGHPQAGGGRGRSPDARRLPPFPPQGPAPGHARGDGGVHRADRLKVSRAGRRAVRPADRGPAFPRPSRSAYDGASHPWRRRP
jgi:pimeloyl-ACP methyl ester carboxylesterase